MKLVLEPALPQDLEQAKAIYGSEKGDLVAPAHSAFWHADNDQDARKRAEWSLQQQKEQFENDPFVRFVKVVDVDQDNEIIAMGRWHDFPNGNEQVGDLEYSGLRSRDDPAAWPDGFPKEAYLRFYDECLAARKEWQGNVHCWILFSIVTREPLRKHGAGSMIVKWGVEQAHKAGAVAFLEAFPEAKSLYEKHGFKEVGRQSFDLGEGATVDVSRMRADP
ncbi:hypothetical protein PRZ48_006405 [Zasmidium cellare]|uniref:N-acetyltransferase domain-containing protein n=1 Tax=Zasmidium cellare TaxID=395010 RepID=A0ABR0EPE3_ZASCE|nr:hypothetical protein PRZ48_006405 [Zasmidium cellare]